MKLFGDNNSSIIQSNMIGQNTEIDRHFIKEKLDNGLIVTTYVPTRLQVTDVFTKGFPAARFQELNGNLGMIDIHLLT
ncbi:Copia protein, partial [Mucuna pruriens]